MADINLYNPEFNEEIFVDESETNEVVNQGNWQFDPEKRYNIYNEQGEAFNVTGDEVAGNLRNGFVLENTDLKDRWETREKERVRLEKEEAEYDSKNFEAFMWALGSDFSFGMLDQAYAKLVNGGGEHLEKLRRYNPYVTTAGSLAGLVSGAFIPFSPVHKVFKGADFIAGKVVKQFLGNGGSKSFVKAVTKQSLRFGVEESLEATAYRVKGLITEDALGTKEFNAENMIAAVKNHSLAETVLGFGLGGAWGGTSHIYNGFKKARNVNKDLAKKFLTDNEVSEILAKDPDKLEKFSDNLINMFSRGKKDYKTDLEFMRDIKKFVKEDGESLDALLQLAKKQMKQNGQEMSLATVDAIMDTKKAKIIDELRSESKSSEFIDAVEEAFLSNKEELMKQLKESGPHMDADIHKLWMRRRDIDSRIYKRKSQVGVSDLKTADTNAAEKYVATTYNDIISEQLGILDDGILKNYNNLKDRYHFFQDGELLERMTKQAAKKDVKGEQGIFDILVEVGKGMLIDTFGYGFLSIPNWFKAGKICAGKIIGIDGPAGMKQLQGLWKASEGISHARRGFAKQAVTGIAFTGVHTAGSLLSAMNQDDMKGKSKEAKFEYVSDRITRMANDPDRLYKETEGKSDLSPYARKSTAQAQVSQVNAIQYMDSKLPRDPATSASSVQGVLSRRRWKPSKSEMLKYEKDVLQASVDPISVFKDIGNLTVSKGQIETLQTVYPEMYQNMLSDIMEAAGENEMPFKNRVKLSMVFGIELDSSVQPQTITKLQQVAMSQAEQQVEQQSQGLPGGASLEGAERSDSGLNKAVNRRA